jgi:glycosyltransferase involved in cell wall biosynthesis
MEALPRISVVTPSRNQGRFIARTIESVLAQQYPNLEHMVVDGMSTDETPRILASYPHLRIIRERDRGQTDALNKGFRAATGDILCFLNSDDTFCPGALHRVAREIDPARHRHVIVGRCAYIDEDDRPTGLEHPSAFIGHPRMLAVWKGNTIPQPATFWSREVWEQCGPLDEREHHVLDYELFCRFSRTYKFHFLDQVLANYRLHANSKTCLRGRDEIVEEAIRASRKHWGPKWRPLYWRLACSLAWFRIESMWDRVGQVEQFTRLGHLWRQRHCRIRSDACRLAAAFLDPVTTIRLQIRHRLPTRFARLLAGHGEELWPEGHCRPETLLWRGFTEQYDSSGFVGPTFVARIHTESCHRFLNVLGEEFVQQGPRPLEIAVHVDGRLVLRHQQRRSKAIKIVVPVGGLTPGCHELKLTSSGWYMLSEYRGDKDYRPISFRLTGLWLDGSCAQPRQTA